MVHGGMTLVKYLLFLFNFVFWLSGVGLFIVGVYVQIKHHQSLNILGDQFVTGPMLLIALGGSIAVLGFFGCCGAIRENYCMTMTFAVLLGVILIVEMGAGIAGYVLWKQIQIELADRMGEGMVEYGNGESRKGITTAWDAMQQNFDCCGVLGYTDWANATSLMDTSDVPDSCCVRMQKKCGIGVRDLSEEEARDKVFMMGCVPAMDSWVAINVAVVGGVIAAIASIQFAVLLGVILIVEMGAGIAGYVLWKQIQIELADRMGEGMVEYGNGESRKGITTAWDAMQQNFDCCGVLGYTDWANATSLMDTSDVPDSCCVRMQKKCGIGVRDLSEEEARDKVFMMGCVPAMDSWVAINVAVVGGVIAAIASIQVLVIICACLFSKLLRIFYDC